MDKDIIDLLESVKVSKAEIERIEKENVNINQFFPSMPHNFEKYSTGETSYWPELMSSVSCAKSKRGKCSAKTFSHDINLYKNTNALIKRPIALDKKEQNQDENTEEQKEEKVTEKRLCDAVVIIESEDKEDSEDKEESEDEESEDEGSEDASVFTSLEEAQTQNFDKDGFFVKAEDVDEVTKREYLIHCESIFDSLVWVSKIPMTSDFYLQRKSLIESSIVKDITSAKHYKSEKKYRECLKSLNRAIIMDFNNPFYLADRAEVYIILGDIQSALQNYSRAVFLYKSSPVFRSRLPKLYCFQGQVFLNLKMYQEALKAFVNASKWDPLQLIYKAKSFSCLVKMNCIPQAWTTLKSLIHQYPNNLDLIVMKARLRHLTGEYSLAFYDLENIAEIKDNACACEMLETIKNKAEEYRQVTIKLNMQQHFYPAIKKINLAIKLWPTQAKFYFLRGILYRHISEFTLSIDDLIEALQKSTPEEKEMFASDAEKQLLLTFNDFSVECFTKGYFDDAIQLLNKAISVEKMQKGLYLNRAECFYQKGDYHFALQDYEQALELDIFDRKYFPRISEICYLLAMQYYSDRNFEESVVKLDQAVCYSPTSGQLYILRAKCKRILQDLHGARYDILLGFHLMPTSKDILPVFGYLFPSIQTKHILTSPLATQTRIAAEELLSDPLHQSLERTSSFTAGESSVLTSILTDPLTVLGNQPPTLLQPIWCSTPDLLQEKKKINTKIKQVQSTKDPLQTSEHKLRTLSNTSVWETPLSKPEEERIIQNSFNKE